MMTLANRLMMNMPVLGNGGSADIPTDKLLAFVDLRNVTSRVIKNHEKSLLSGQFELYKGSSKKAHNIITSDNGGMYFDDTFLVLENANILIEDSEYTVLTSFSSKNYNSSNGSRVIQKQDNKTRIDMSYAYGTFRMNGSIISKSLDANEYVKCLVNIGSSFYADIKQNGIDKSNGGAPYSFKPDGSYKYLTIGAYFYREYEFSPAMETTVKYAAIYNKKLSNEEIAQFYNAIGA